MTIWLFAGLFSAAFMFGIPVGMFIATKLLRGAVPMPEPIRSRVPHLGGEHYYG